MHIKKVRPLHIWQTNGAVVAVPGNSKVTYTMQSPGIPIPSGEAQTLHLWNVLATITQDSDFFDSPSGIYLGVNLYEDEALTAWLVSMFLAAYGPPSKYAAGAGAGGLELGASANVNIGASSSGDVPLLEIPDLIMLAGNGLGGAGYPRFAAVYCQLEAKNLTANPHNVSGLLSVAWSLEN